MSFSPEDRQADGGVLFEPQAQTTLAFISRNSRVLLLAEELVCDDLLRVRLVQYMHVYGLFQCDWMEIKLVVVLHMLLQLMMNGDKAQGDGGRESVGVGWGWRV